MTSDVAVIVTAYNYGRWLPEALASLDQQTHPPAEIVIVDDASTDVATVALLDRREAEGRRVIRRGSNGGPSAARNTALAEITSPYVVCLDADDLLGPRHCELGATALDADPEVGLVRLSTEFIGDSTGVLPLGGGTVAHLLLSNWVPQASMFRRADAEAVGGYEERLRIYEDHDLWLAIVGLGRRIEIIDEVTHFYRRHGTQATSHLDHDRQVAAKALIMRKHAAQYAEHAEEVWRILGQRDRVLDSFKRRYGPALRVVHRLRRWLRR